MAGEEARGSLERARAAVYLAKARADIWMKPLKMQNGKSPSPASLSYASLCRPSRRYLIAQTFKFLRSIRFFLPSYRSALLRCSSTRSIPISLPSHLRKSSLPYLGGPDFAPFFLRFSFHGYIGLCFEPPFLLPLSSFLPFVHEI